MGSDDVEPHEAGHHPRQAAEYSRWMEMHTQQLAAIGLPLAYWPALYTAVSEQRFDAGSWVQFAMDEEGSLFVLANRDIETVATDSGNDGEPPGLMLFDHAWSFATLADARQSLYVVHDLLPRIHALLLPGVALEDAEGAEAAVQRVMQALPGRVGCYQAPPSPETDDSARGTTFFVLDEVGARLGLAEEPRRQVHQAQHAQHAQQAQMQARANQCARVGALASGLEPESESNGEQQAKDVERETVDEPEPVPNYECKPFFSINDGVGYSVAWPRSPVAVGDELVVSKTDSQTAWGRLSNSADSKPGLACEGPTAAEFDRFQTALVAQAQSAQLAGDMSVMTRAVDAAAHQPQFNERAAHVLTTAKVREFEQTGVVIIDCALQLDGGTGARSLRQELLAWTEKHPLESMMQEHARQDVVGWLTRQQAADAGGATAAAMSLLEGVAHKLNCSLNLGLVAPHQCMCACYDGGGAHYVAHRDNTCVDANGEIDCTNSREVTAILYTSENWREEHGGCLRVYQSAPDAPSANYEDYTDIEPMAGRLVIFKSQKVLHEVRPSFAKRIALSMWMLRTSSSPPIIVD